MPKLAKTAKHDVDVVVDRLKVRDDMRQRLAESFETALRHAPTAAHRRGNGWRAAHLFSAKFACPVCSYSFAGTGAAALSFNNPMGACPPATAWGDPVFDPRSCPDLSLAAGAIRGWDKRNQFYFQMLESPAAHYGFDTTPFERLADEVQKVVLYGSGREQMLPFHYLKRAGHAWSPQHSFEGIIPTWSGATGNRLGGGAGRTGEIPQQPRPAPLRRHPGCAGSPPRQIHGRRRHPARNQPPALGEPRFFNLLPPRPARRPRWRKKSSRNHLAARLPHQRRPRITCA